MEGGVEFKEREREIGERMPKSVGSSWPVLETRCQYHPSPSEVSSVMGTLHWLPESLGCCPRGQPLIYFSKDQ